MRSPERSLSAREPEGDDYPLDGIAPDDLPVRDIRGDEGDWRSPDEAGAEALGGSHQRPAGARVVAVGSLEVMGAALEIAPSPTAPDDQEPTPEASIPVPQVDTEAAEPPAQYMLPGLEPDAVSGQDHAPKRLARSKRPRARSDRHAHRTDQIELWPQTVGPSSER